MRSHREVLVGSLGPSTLSGNSAPSFLFCRFAAKSRAYERRGKEWRSAEEVRLGANAVLKHGLSVKATSTVSLRFGVGRLRSMEESAMDLQEVDPVTGEIIEGSSLASTAPERLTASDGFTWAFRRAEGQPGKTPVVCLHGIGSCSYVYRNTIRLLGSDGHEAVALDWLGYGASDKPSPREFPYTTDAYIQALDAALNELKIWKLGNGKIALIVQGFVLGQIGMLWASQNSDKIEKLIVLNTPLSRSAKLRPELAAYKSPLAFLRPKPDSKFDAANFNAAGSPYAMAYRDAMAYQQPFDGDSAAAEALHSTMERLDWGDLLMRVDESFQSWKVPSLLIHGTKDPFLNLKDALQWLETKRTSMRMASGIEAKLGHMPQEDYADAIHPAILEFIEDSSS